MNLGISFSRAAEEGDACKTSAECGDLACAPDTKTCELCDPDLDVVCNPGSTCDFISGLCKKSSAPLEKPVSEAPLSQLTGDSCGACLQSQLSSCSDQSDVASCLRSGTGKCSAQCSKSADCQSCVQNRMNICGTSQGKTEIQQCIDSTFSSYCKDQCKAATSTEGEDPTQASSSAGIDLFGIVKADSLPGLIQGMYTYSLSVVGLLVFIQILRAAFLWGTAAGNAGKIGQARGILENAVVGTVLLFGAYLILKTINPDFVDLSFSFGALQNVNPGSASQQDNPNNPGNDNPEQTSCGDFNLVCSGSAQTCPALVSEGSRYLAFIPQVAKDHPIPGANTTKFLEAIMRIESNGKLDAQSGAGACGLTQFLPSTANKFRNFCGFSQAITCDILRGQNLPSGMTQDDAAKLDLCLTAEYAKSIINGSDYHGQLRDVAAGYNGGDSGAKSALGASVSCSSQSTATKKYEKDCSDRPTLRYECLWDDTAHTKCNDGYKETRNYAAKFNSCYGQ